MKDAEVMLHIPKVLGRAICGSRDRDVMGNQDDVQVCNHIEGWPHVIDEDGIYCDRCKDGMSRGVIRSVLTVDNPEWAEITCKDFTLAENLRQSQVWRHQ